MKTFERFVECLKIDTFFWSVNIKKNNQKFTILKQVCKKTANLFFDDVLHVEKFLTTKRTQILI